jgi:hypothetical protein
MAAFPFPDVRALEKIMKNIKWQLALSAVLVVVALALHVVHFLIFRDARHIVIYLLGDLAFLPLEVLFVTLIINQLLSNREKRIKLKKMNMAIGTFFSEAGSALLKSFLAFDKNREALKTMILHDQRWADGDFGGLLKKLPGHVHDIDSQSGDLGALKQFLVARRTFLLSLLGNANLLEHDKFTDLLWSVFHLADELGHRDDFGRLPAADLQHLAQDLRRAFVLLLQEWFAYMRHLKHDYPYLFSLAMRTNPFDREGSAIIA